MRIWFKEKYHGVESIQQRSRKFYCFHNRLKLLSNLIRYKELVLMWKSLLEKLDTCRGVLSCANDLMVVLTEIDDCLSSMQEVEVGRNCMMFVFFLSFTLFKLNFLVSACAEVR